MGDAVRMGVRDGVWERSDLVLTTKIFFGAGMKRGKSKRQNRIGLSRKHLTEGLAQSLERMGLSYVDVCFCHRPDPVTPIEETVRTFTDLIAAGKCFYWGTSEWSAAQLLEANPLIIPPDSPAHGGGFTLRSARSFALTLCARRAPR